jgi:hypothetical protein
MGSGGGSVSETGAELERKVRGPKRAAKLTGAEGTCSPAEQITQMIVLPFSVADTGRQTMVGLLGSHLPCSA